MQQPGDHLQRNTDTNNINIDPYFGQEMVLKTPPNRFDVMELKQRTGSSNQDKKKINISPVQLKNSKSLKFVFALNYTLQQILEFSINAIEIKFFEKQYKRLSDMLYQEERWRVG